MLCQREHLKASGLPVRIIDLSVRANLFPVFMSHYQLGCHMVAIVPIYAQVNIYTGLR